MEDEHRFLMFLVSFRRLLGRPRGVVLHSALQVVFYIRGQEYVLLGMDALVKDLASCISQTP